MQIEPPNDAGLRRLADLVRTQRVAMAASVAGATPIGLGEHQTVIPARRGSA